MFLFHFGRLSSFAEDWRLAPADPSSRVSNAPTFATEALPKNGCVCKFEVLFSDMAETRFFFSWASMWVMPAYLMKPGFEKNSRILSIENIRWWLDFFLSCSLLTRCTIFCQV